jgi:hypothetical protein
MLKKRWKIKDVEDIYIVKSLADTLNISEVLSNLLILRNIKTLTRLKTFSDPLWTH